MIDIILNFDTLAQGFVFSLRNPFFDVFMPFITIFGGKEVIFPMAFLVSVYLFKKKRYHFIFSLLGSMGIAGVVVYLTKSIFDRARPDEIYALLKEDGFSFPSGHATLALVFWGILVYFIFVSDNKKSHKISALAIGILLVLLVGFSRVYLGVHWPSDVLGGFLLGGALLAISIYVSKREVQPPFGGSTSKTKLYNLPP